MNMFARFDENPAMTLQDIKETKRYGRTDARTDNVKTVYPPQTKFAGGIITLKEFSNCFLSYGHKLHTCANVKEHIEDKIFKILYIISHNTYNYRDQPLRFILTFKSNRSMVSFGRKHCKQGKFD